MFIKAYSIVSIMSELPQPPWVYSPGEVRRWQFSVAGHVKKGGGKKAEKKLENVKIKIWLNCKREGKVFEVNEDFDMHRTALIILKAFSNAKFKKVSKVELDTSIHETNEKIKDIINKWNAEEECEKIKLIVEYKNGNATIDISRKHLRGYPSITIHLKTIHINRYNRILNYLKRHLPIERIVED